MILEFRTIVPKALQGKGSRVYLRFLSAHNVTFNESLKAIIFVITKEWSSYLIPEFSFQFLL